MAVFTPKVEVDSIAELAKFSEHKGSGVVEMSPKTLVWGLLYIIVTLQLRHNRGILES